MSSSSRCAGQIVYDFEEFCRDYGHPAGKCFTFEVTSNAVTYVYARVAGEVDGDQVVFDLTDEDLVGTHKAH
jgi:hypothetical protein